jgi:Ca2+-binding RTX toxin-like protein
VLTSTADGSRTVAQVETYQGPVDYLQSQFIYDGTAALAIVAQTPNVFIKNVAGSAAVELLSGQNVVDAGHGSNFLLGGTGTDVFFLDARQPVETWDTIVGFNPGDIATLWGFKDGVSRYWWDDNAGVTGYTGRTLRADLAGTGHIDASITFANTTAANTNQYAVTTGSIAGNDYMTIFSL